VVSGRGRTLAVRLDNAGDVLVTGPAVRALAAGSRHLTLLAGPHGRDAAHLLPGVDEVLTWRCPWIDPQPPTVPDAGIDALVETLRAGRFDRAVVFTSFHQSPLPTALVLRTAGIPWVAAISEDYPGSLLDVRHHVDDDLPEPVRALSLTAAAGFRLPAGDGGLLAVRRPLATLVDGLPARPFVVVHPGTSVPARAWQAERHAEACALLADSGHAVVVTGAPGEADLTARVAGARAVDLGGRTTMAQLAAVLAEAAVVVVGNTGPAHLAAAVGTPVVSLFAPTVPARRWSPYGVPTVLLGDQAASCRNTRVTHCPVEGHPCLGSVTPEDVLRAVEKLSGPGQQATVRPHVLAGGTA
jgi:ADP-heptose:LPS heptosyltransferase